MILYLLKFSACLASFILFYKVFLEKENMHQFKRFYLIGSITLSLIIPLIVFTSYIKAQMVPQFIPEFILEAEPLEVQNNYLPFILWSFYGLGVFIFGLKFILNLYQLKNRIRKNVKYNVTKLFYVLLNEHVIPHTFLNYIFLNKRHFEKDQIPREVIWHEETHALQKHSLDILFIEMLQILFWFNPLIYLQKHLIKMNHEFLADQAVINKGIQVPIYQQILLEFSQSTKHPQLANAINYSFIKKRFNIMKTQESKTGIWLRSLIVIPLIGVLLISFSQKVNVEKEISDPLELQTVKSNLENQNGATKEQIATYNKLAKSYNAMSKNEMVVKKADVQSLKYIYDLMTPDQRNDAEPFPKFPPPPPIWDNNGNQSQELQVALKKYSIEAKSYGYAVGTYQKSKDGKEYSQLREQYKLVMQLYSKYKELANDEKDLVPPPPPPPAPKK